MNTKVYIRKIDDYIPDELRMAVKDFLQQGNVQRLAAANTVLIKPNLLADFAPEKAVTTHPAVVEAVIQYLLEAGKEVWLGDSPGGAGNLKQIWQTTGMQALADKYPIKLVSFNTFGVQECDIDGIKLSVSKVVWEADAIISISKYKTHSLMAFTGAIKNLYGLVPGMVKTVYHSEYPNPDLFGRMLNALYYTVSHRVAFHLMDGIVGMDGAGPSAGRARRFGLLMGSTSAPALDYLAATFMGFPLKQVGYIKDALHNDGILPSQIDYPVSFREFKLPNVKRQIPGFSSAMMNYLPPGINLLVKKLFDFYPYINDKCQACQMCVRSCPMHTIKVGQNGIPVIRTEKCIRCLCCHEMCLHQAIDLHKSLLARLILR